MKIRDEMAVTTASYKHLYDSSVTFSLKKQVEADQGIQEME